MNRKDLEALVKQYAAAKEAHDLDATIAMYAEEGTYQSIGFGPVVKGHAELRKFFGALFTAVPDYHGEFVGASYGDESAVVWGSWGGTLAGDFLGLGTKVGNKLDIPAAFVCTFRDGLLVKEVGYFDTAEFCAQAGIKLNVARPGLGSNFAQVYKEFWQAPDRNLTKSAITSDILSNWPGPDGIGKGSVFYQKQIDRVIASIPDIKLEVIDYLAEGELTFLEFRAYGTVGGKPVEFFGIDRFKVSENFPVYELESLLRSDGDATCALAFRTLFPGRIRIELR